MLYVHVLNTENLIVINIQPNLIIRSMIYETDPPGSMDALCSSTNTRGEEALFLSSASDGATVLCSICWPFSPKSYLSLYIYPALIEGGKEG